MSKAALQKTITTQTVFTQYYCAAIMPGIAAAQIKQRQENEAYPSAAQSITRDIAKEGDGIIRKFREVHEGHDWLVAITSVLQRAHHDRGHGSNEGPRHVLVLAATPSLTGHLCVILSDHRELRNIISVRLLSGDSGTARRRNQMLQGIKEEASGSQKTIVVVSTAELVGTGIDALTFCNHLIIFGELFKPYHEKQAIGRVCRRGQTLPVYIYHIRSDHSTHELVRKRNEGRQLMLSDISPVTAVEGTDEDSSEATDEDSSEGAEGGSVYSMDEDGMGASDTDSDSE